MDPAAVWTLAADVECHVWTILQGIFLKKKKETFLENESVEKKQQQNDDDQKPCEHSS